MTARLMIGYGLFLAIAVFLAGVWLYLSRESRARARRHRRGHRAWLRERADLARAAADEEEAERR